MTTDEITQIEQREQSEERRSRGLVSLLRGWRLAFGTVFSKGVAYGEVGPYTQPFQHVAPCIIMSQGNGLRPSKLPRQGCIPRHVLVPLPALGPMPVPTLVVPGSSTVLRDSSLSHVSW